MKILGIGYYERNWKGYKHFQRGQRSYLNSDSSKKQAVLYGVAKMHKNYIMGTRYVYKFTDVIVDMGLDNIVHNDG